MTIEKDTVKQRLPEMDVMKGILSILVILGHIVYIEGVFSGVQLAGPSIDAQNIFVGVWIAPYYMAAFFFVTGYCSSFSRDLKAQVITDARNLILPNFTISPLMTAIAILVGVRSGWAFTMHWFLYSLFWVKIIVKLFKNYVKNESLSWFLLVIMSVIGSVMMYYIPEKNILGYQQALVFPLFLALGHTVRRFQFKSWVFYLAMIVYVFSAILSFYYLYWGAPSLCAITTFSPEKWPMYFLLAASGTLGVYQISRLLVRSRFLQYLGRNSLVIYVTHGTFLSIVTSFMKTQIAQYHGDACFQYSYFVLMALGALLWSCLWAEVLRSVEVNIFDVNKFVEKYENRTES